MLPSLKNAMPLASIHCIYTLSHEWTLSRCSADSWVVSPLSPLRSSLGQTSPSAPCWPIAVPDDPRASCSVSPAWPGRTGTWRWSCPKMGKQQNKWRSWSSLPWKIHTCRAQPKMETQQAAVKLQRGFWASNVEVWSKHGTITSKFDASDKPPMQVHSWSVLEKKYTWNKISGCREGGWKTYRCGSPRLMDWRKFPQTHANMWIICVCVYIYIWMDGWMDGWMDVYVYIYIYIYVYVYVYVCVCITCQNSLCFNCKLYRRIIPSGVSATGSPAWYCSCICPAAPWQTGKWVAGACISLKIALGLPKNC